MASARFSSVLVALTLAASALSCLNALAAPQLPIIISVDPIGTWLRVGPRDFRHASTRLDLQASHILAGDKLTLMELGGYDCSVGNHCGIVNNMLAVFVDANNNLIFPDPTLSVNFVVSPPSLFDGVSTDVPQDFWVPPAAQSVDVIVPAGAVALLFGPDDSFFSDNGSVGYGAYVGCGAVIDGIIKEYDTFNVVNIVTGLPFNPKCRDFSQTRHSYYFSFAEINTGDYAWALIRAPLIDSSLSYIGLDAWRNSFGGSRIINSGYRNPLHNANLQPIPGAHGSRHMFGDAADLRNVSGSMPEYNAMRSAAHAAHADYVELPSGPCQTKCVHADWRNHQGAYHD